MYTPPCFRSGPRRGRCFEWTSVETVEDPRSSFVRGWGCGKEWILSGASKRVALVYPSRSHAPAREVRSETPDLPGSEGVQSYMFPPSRSPPTPLCRTWSPLSVSHPDRTETIQCLWSPLPTTEWTTGTPGHHRTRTPKDTHLPVSPSPDVWSEVQM